MRVTTRAGVALGFGALLLVPRAGRAQVSGRIPVVATPHFAFYSDFEPNLNDALIAAGAARKAGKPELFPCGSEASCFEKLPPSARAAWDGAVSYYNEIVSSTSTNDQQRYLLRAQLARFDDEWKDAGSRQFVEIARSFRAVATPAYRACRWTAQDEKALDRAAKNADWRLPGDLWHVVLFYTTGEAVRRVLDEGGKPGYTPMVYAIFARGAWPGYRQPLESAWRPYVDGARTLPQVAADLIDALRKASPPL